MPLAETQKHAKHEGPEVRTEKARDGETLGWEKTGMGKSWDRKKAGCHRLLKLYKIAGNGNVRWDG